jgi:hypothetical protein
MKYVDLINILRGKAFDAIEFNVLAKNAHPASVSMLQCQGDITAKAEAITAADDAVFVKKAWQFIQEVKKKQPDLALTPEYSIPWSLIGRLIEEHAFPHEKKLWIFGCESTSIERFQAFRSEWDTVHWEVDEEALATQQGRFLDPLIIVFQVKIGEQIKTCVAVQFKATQMGGSFANRIEADNLILGTQRFYLKPQNSIALVPLICSDMFEFNHRDLPEYTDYSYLICHVQMTPDPFNNIFSQPRNNLYLSGFGEKYEFLCLNWASGTRINDDVMSWDYGGSAYYLKPDGFDKPEKGHDCFREPHQIDQKLQSNHNKGLYLKFCLARRIAVYYLWSDEHVHWFNISKVDQSLAAPAQKHRAGATSTGILVWGSAAWLDKGDVPIEDGIVLISQNFKTLPDTAVNIPVVERERLFAISTAKIKTEKWFYSRNLQGFQISEEGEKPGGVTVRIRSSQDEEINSLLGSVSYLTGTILSKLSGFDFPFRELKRDDLELKLWVDGSRISNLHGNEGDANAVAAYIGSTSEAIAKQTHQSMQKHTKADRVLVFYNDGEDRLECSKPKSIDQGAITPGDITSG